MKSRSTVQADVASVELLPSWWQKSLRSRPVSMFQVPKWLQVEQLPRVTIDAQIPWTVNQRLDVLAAMRGSTLAKPHPLILTLKQHSPETELADFAWAVFSSWQEGDGDGKDNWAMVGLGLWGNDATVLQLTPLLKEMPGQGLYKRAGLGLDCLAAIGSDTALMNINEIANRIRYQSLKTKANDCMNAIGKARNLTREQLEDRIVPDCGLDQRGERWFDYGDSLRPTEGQRRFQVVFGEEMKLLVRDPVGQIKPNLPKPKATDDPVQAAQAQAAWKLLKQQVSGVVKAQVKRFEQAMVQARRWEVDEFATVVVPHPLLGHLVRRLVWGWYDRQHQLQTTFRVTEDRTYADLQDEAWVLPETGYVGVVHPAHLSQADRATWGELLSDYELIQPFRQLSRTVIGLEPEEVNGYEILRFQRIAVANRIAVTILQKSGWSYRQDENRNLHYKPIAYAGVTAVVQHNGGSGFYFGYDSGTSQLLRCWFVPGGTESLLPEQLVPSAALPLREVDAVAFSEVLRTLGAIVSKAEN